jgi:hypothetical protein
LLSEKLGGRTRARTWDPLIKSQLLYQLSYAPETRARESFGKAGRLAKRPPDVQQSGPIFPRLQPPSMTAKSRRIPAA